MRDRNNPHTNEDAQKQGYLVVKDIPYGLHTLLVSAGMKTAAEALNYFPVMILSLWKNYLQNNGIFMSFAVSTMI